MNPSCLWRTPFALSMPSEWIWASYVHVRRHTSIGDLSPVEFEALHTAANVAA